MKIIFIYCSFSHACPLMKDLAGNRGTVGLFGPQLNGRLPPLVLSHDSDVPGSVVAVLPKDDQLKFDFRGCGLSFTSTCSFLFLLFQNSVPHCVRLTKPLASRAPSCETSLARPPPVLGVPKWTALKRKKNYDNCSN